MPTFVAYTRSIMASSAQPFHANSSNTPGVPKKPTATTGFTFAIELSVKTYFAGYKICEVPCTWRDLTNRKSNFKVLEWLPYYIYWLLYSIFNNLKKNA